MTLTMPMPTRKPSKIKGEVFDLFSYRFLLWQQLIQQIHNPCLSLPKNASESDVPEDMMLKRKISAKVILNQLKCLEIYWAFPGMSVVDKILIDIELKRFEQAKKLITNVIAALEKPRKQRFEPYVSPLNKLDKTIFEANDNKQAKPCFELLIYHPNPKDYYDLYYRTLSSLQTERDEFYYDIVFVDNLADALCAILSNENIQACLSVSNQRKNSENQTANDMLTLFENEHTNTATDHVFSFLTLAKNLRPELEHYYLAEVAFATLPPEYFESFNRVFYHEHPFKDLHFHLLNGVRERVNTPFYNALSAYSKKPKGVFHALPISRASSIKNSVWLADFYQFYGNNVFLAETSSTQGGMDSLLNPKGVIKNAQNKVAKCFGSQQSYFVTNGTSTANKIVIQANVQPGDIILVSSDCHKSVPYGIMLSGAHAVFLQTNSVDAEDLYGAVSLTLIKTRLLALKAEGLLDKVKEIILTNSTFDGLVYDVEHYMSEILAIKPDIIFHWDEAWFAHAHFNPLYQNRHAMSVAAKLQQRFSSAEYRALYQAMPPEEQEQHPDPTKVSLRVYATQSTHKTLSCFRQGSMIHIFDAQFNQDIFLEALYTHSSTSPNYQILGSLDVARRQMNIEGFALTQKSIRLAQYIREQMQNDVNISTIFSTLTADDIYPTNKVAPHASSASDGNLPYLTLLETFNGGNFVIDPTRITIDIRKTGMQGHAFRQLLIDRYDIQVNKTSEFTVLFIINIGATIETANYLLTVLREISEYIITSPTPITPLKKSKEGERAEMPTLRHYHPLFTPHFAKNKNENKNSSVRLNSAVDMIDMRKAYYSAYQRENIDYISLNHDVMSLAKKGKTWVSAAYVTPYPPGFPILVPGQIINFNILDYFSNISTNEIHGYHPTLGLKVFSDNYLTLSTSSIVTNEASNDSK